MPSPLGHALGGLAAGWAVLPRQRGTESHRGRAPFGPGLRIVPLQTGLLAAAALLPDLDLLFGAHSQWTHSIGAVLIVFAVARSLGGRRHSRFAFALAAAFATHPFLDWLGQDGTPPYGIMAAWPFSERYFHSDLDLFTGISRRYWLPGFLSHNFWAVTREIALLAPVALAVWLAKRR